MARIIEVLPRHKEKAIKTALSQDNSDLDGVRLRRFMVWYAIRDEFDENTAVRISNVEPYEPYEPFQYVIKIRKRVIEDSYTIYSPIDLTKIPDDPPFSFVLFGVPARIKAHG